jgi:hypothetical protein
MWRTVWLRSGLLESEIEAIEILGLELVHPDVTQRRLQIRLYEVPVVRDRHW